MKKWTITVTCNYVTLENKYTAYAEEDPINNIIDEDFEGLADDLYNDYSSRITEDYDEFVEDVQIYSKPAEEGEDYAIIYDERDEINDSDEIVKWTVACCGGTGCELYFTAYSVENPVHFDLIPPEKLDEMSNELYEEFSYTIDTEDEDEVEDFLGSITFKAWLAYDTDGDNDIVYDERNN